MNLPNKLTMIRIFCTPLVVILFYCKLYILAAVVFIAASLTDMLDGKIARKRNLVTVFGKFVDPLADKLINLASIIILSASIMENEMKWYGILAVVATVVITSREMIITSFRALAANEGVVIAADKMGKYKTVTQDIAIVAMFLDESALIDKLFIGELIHWTAVTALSAALVLTILSGINYFVANKELVKKIGEDI